MENTGSQNVALFDDDPADLIREHRRYYLMVNAISKRVRQLQLGDRALALPAGGSRDPIYIAQEEFLQGKLAITQRTAALHFEEEAEDMSSDMELLGLDDDGVSLDGSDDEE